MLISGLCLNLIYAHHQFPQPQAVLVLGGGIERERFAAQLVQTRPSLDVWISTGISNQVSKQIFNDANIPLTRLHLDRRAIDTVTNFTSLAADFRQQNIRHLYLITSDFHMRRSKAIAFIVFGSRGIAFTPVPVLSDYPQETLLHVARDVGRSLLWLTTGHTGASLHKL